MEDQRGRPKTATAPLRIRIDRIDEFTEQHAEELSSGGIVIPMHHRPRTGTMVDVEFHLARDKKTIRLCGAATRPFSDTRTGRSRVNVRIEFIYLDEVAKKFVEMAIENYNQRHPTEKLDLPDGFFGDAEQQLEAAAKWQTEALAVPYMSDPKNRTTRMKLLDTLPDEDLRRMIDDPANYPEQLRNRARKILELRGAINRGTPE